MVRRGDGEEGGGDTMWEEVDARIHCLLTPRAIGVGARALERALVRPRLLQFVPALGGVLLGCRDVRVEDVGEASMEHAMIQVTVAMRVLLFAPRVDHCVPGVVLEVTPDHLNVRVFRIFRAVLMLRGAPGYSYRSLEVADAEASLDAALRPPSLQTDERHSGVWEGTNSAEGVQEIGVGSRVSLRVAGLQGVENGIILIHAQLDKVLSERGHADVGADDQAAQGPQEGAAEQESDGSAIVDDFPVVLKGEPLALQALRDSIVIGDALGGMADTKRKAKKESRKRKGKSDKESGASSDEQSAEKKKERKKIKLEKRRVKLEKA
ncbi:hypothetical protein FVE85_2796 [Porphyridium purpureum]|uniref:DNA-directed RNA polymerase I subunit rpa43 n=1 Tax=Porphyridium purpureum TaxID=35688 RepID=A0A5J4YTK8_PORPP|nr:hypothetical protein FVE85_2796 [Porphyridium purpureum]|eukprot:POR2682..scf227_4